MLALITGTSAGFGAALARKLAAKGHRVIGTARRADRLEALQAELRGSFLPLTFDIQDIDAMQAALASLPDDWRDIDLLVNNAGLALGIAPAQDAKLADWLTMIDTNIRGLAAITHALLPAMAAQGRGHIINIGSTAGTWPYKGSNVYGASKAFVKQFSQNLRADLIGTPIRVTNIEPGMIAGTEFSNVRLQDDAAAAAVYAGCENMTAEDIADIILWCAEQPARININRMEIMPTVQTFNGLAVSRQHES